MPNPERQFAIRQSRQPTRVERRCTAQKISPLTLVWCYGSGAGEFSQYVSPSPARRSGHRLPPARRDRSEGCEARRGVTYVTSQQLSFIRYGSGHARRVSAGLERHDLVTPKRRTPMDRKPVDAEFRHKVRERYNQATAQIDPIIDLAITRTRLQIDRPDDPVSLADIQKLLETAVAVYTAKCGPLERSSAAWLMLKAISRCVKKQECSDPVLRVEQPREAAR